MLPAYTASRNVKHQLSKQSAATDRVTVSKWRRDDIEKLANRNKMKIRSEGSSNNPIDNGQSAIQ